VAERHVAAARAGDPIRAAPAGRVVAGAPVRRSLPLPPSRRSSPPAGQPVGSPAAVEPVRRPGRAERPCHRRRRGGRLRQPGDPNGLGAPAGRHRHRRRCRERQREDRHENQRTGPARPLRRSLPEAKRESRRQMCERRSTNSRHQQQTRSAIWLLRAQRCPDRHPPAPLARTAARRADAAARAAAPAPIRPQLDPAPARRGRASLRSRRSRFPRAPPRSPVTGCSARCRRSRARRSKPCRAAGPSRCSRPITRACSRSALRSRLGAVSLRPLAPVDVDALLAAGAVGITLPAGALARPDGLDHCGALLERLARHDAPLLVHPGPGSWRAWRPQPHPETAAPGWWPAMTRYVADMNAAWHAFAAFGRRQHRRLRVVFAMLAGGAAARRAARRARRTGASALRQARLP
jgi:hypothetical protein